mmetsp:Transcript_7796/g.11548  ORF Transcript_7796/g.11548 Transcript_7796/m.11548 type:complete len:1061 (+) Transcript_7796:217-3399(+)
MGPDGKLLILPAGGELPMPPAGEGVFPRKSHSNQLKQILPQKDVEELVSRYEERARLLLEDHKRELREAAFDAFRVNPEVASGAASIPVHNTSSRGQHIENVDRVEDDGRGFIRANRIFSGFDLQLDLDTFAMMMISKPGSKSWFLSGFSFSFQITLGTMILIDQLDGSKNNNRLDVPFKVTPVVYVGQVLSMILCLSTQTDVLTSIRSLILMGEGSNWDIAVGEAGKRTKLNWFIHIAFPNIIKFLEGILVMVVSWMIIVQSDNIIDLLKDFTALMFISEIDNILFQLAAYGYLGDALRKETEKVIAVKITVHGMRTRLKVGTVFVRAIFLSLLAGMFGSWTAIVIKQVNGDYFIGKFKNCGQYDLVKKFGDGICYGGPLNNIECGFEYGDCVNFNLAYPDCKGPNLEKLIDVQKTMANQICDPEFAIPECQFDAGDCCSYAIQGSELFGDGTCNGGMISSELCGYDNGDCLDFKREYPSCPLEEIAKDKASESVILGDGVCDSNLYASEECGYEAKDCGIGQIGQDITFDGISSGSAAVFRYEASGDASTIVLGKYKTDINQKYNETAPGIMSIMKYNSTERKWLESIQLQGNDASEKFGKGLATNADGSVVAIGTPSDDGFFGNVKVVQFIQQLNEWQQFGQTFRGESGHTLGKQVDMADDGSRIAISSPRSEVVKGSIKVFDMDASTQSWVQVGQTISGEMNDFLGSISLKLSPKDGSRLFFSRENFIDTPFRLDMYEFNNMSKEWNQVGDVIALPTAAERNPLAINGDGSRIAVSSYSHDPDSNGEVTVYDLKTNEGQITWSEIFLLNSTSDADLRIGNGFGYSTSFSQDGNLLAISSVNLACDGTPEFCPTGSVRLYRYSVRNNPKNLFALLPLKRVPGYGNVVQEIERATDGNIMGLDISLSRNEQKLSVSGFDIKHNNGFVKVYEVNELFYPDCLVPDPEEIGDGTCYDDEPYFAAVCAFDGGDCRDTQPHPLYPECLVVQPNGIGNGICYDVPPYNSAKCNFDGGDCNTPETHPDYPNCVVSVPSYIGDDYCDDQPPYNGFDCGFDGGDCL